MTRNAHQLDNRVVPFERTDDETLFTVEEVPTLLPCKEVDAVCRSIKKVHYSPYQQEKWVFAFCVITPEQHAGTVLEMFVRLDRRWKAPPVSSKLFKAACVATRLLKGERITQSMFLNKVFRCQLRKSGKGPAAYTVVDKLMEKLTS